jgi:hypothetical protein
MEARMAMKGSIALVGLVLVAMAGAAEKDGRTPRRLRELNAIRDRHRAEVMALPGVVGLGVGASSRDPSKLVITVHVHTATPELREAIAARLENAPLEIREAGESKAD